VHQLAGVLLEVDPVEPDGAEGPALAAHLDVPAGRERAVVLGDLVALRQVG